MGAIVRLSLFVGFLIFNMKAFALGASLATLAAADKPDYTAMWQKFKQDYNKELAFAPTMTLWTQARPPLSSTILPLWCRPSSSEMHVNFESSLVHADLIVRFQPLPVGFPFLCGSSYRVR